MKWCFIEFVLEMLSYVLDLVPKLSFSCFSIEETVAFSNISLLFKHICCISKDISSHIKQISAIHTAYP
jgi:hypothetical protein